MLSCVQTDGPPRPFALDSFHTSVLAPPLNMVMLLSKGSYTSWAKLLGDGEPGALRGTVLIHCGVPPSPCALVSTQTALESLLPSLPPKTISRALAVSYAAPEK